MSKLKKFEIHWEAIVSGIQVVEALDTQDAVDRFDPCINLDMLANEPVYGIQKVRAAKKKKALISRRGSRC